MAQVLVRDIEPTVVDRLKDRSRRSGRSLEADLRLILQDAVRDSIDEEITRVRRANVQRQRGFDPR